MENKTLQIYKGFSKRWCVSSKINSACKTGRHVYSLDLFSQRVFHGSSKNICCEDVFFKHKRIRSLRRRECKSLYNFDLIKLMSLFKGTGCRENEFS